MTPTHLISDKPVRMPPPSGPLDTLRSPEVTGDIGDFSRVARTNGNCGILCRPSYGGRDGRKRVRRTATGTTTTTGGTTTVFVCAVRLISLLGESAPPELPSGYGLVVEVSKRKRGLFLAASGVRTGQAYSNRPHALGSSLACGHFFSRSGYFR